MHFSLVVIHQSDSNIFTGNIAVQLFTPKTREFYNLEMLWAVGHSDEPTVQTDSVLEDLWSRVQAWDVAENSFNDQATVQENDKIIPSKNDC